MILGRLLLAGRGVVDLDAYAAQLLAWQDRMVRLGSLDLLGPSTLKALTAYRAGVPATETGRWGDTNGRRCGGAAGDPSCRRTHWWAWSRRSRGLTS